MLLKGGGTSTYNGRPWPETKPYLDIQIVTASRAERWGNCGQVYISRMSKEGKGRGGHNTKAQPRVADVPHRLRRAQEMERL